MYARLVRADVEAKAGRHDKALELLNPLVDEINALDLEIGLTYSTNAWSLVD